MSSLRGRILHFLRRVPTVLQPYLRLSELLRSLAICDPRTAKLRAYRLYLASESLPWPRKACSRLRDPVSRLAVLRREGPKGRWFGHDPHGCEEGDPWPGAALRGS
ncbi:DUF6538 domain-containing protein [Methylobacterium sp. Leaf399]|uniref:DUF6538 domain-containing protein n=1 Tax=Methylobacterium sp. Leaf399 TaxID=1736364 RepID=UPI003FCD59EB